MGRKKKVEVEASPDEEVIEEEEVLPEGVKLEIAPLDATEFNRTDLNKMASKINEIISSLK